jgi:hypothetical protein
MRSAKLLFLLVAFASRLAAAANPPPSGIKNSRSLSEYKERLYHAHDRISGRRGHEATTLRLKAALIDARAMKPSDFTAKKAALSKANAKAKAQPAARAEKPAAPPQPERYGLATYRISGKVYHVAVKALEEAHAVDPRISYETTGVSYSGGSFWNGRSDVTISGPESSATFEWLKNRLYSLGVHYGA